LNFSTTGTNPAIGAALDGRDVGCLFDRLPGLAAPLQPAPTPPSSTQPESAPGTPKS
jgi:hypothetical protein